MPNKVEISKVKVKIGNNETELSIKEILELRDILNETFPKKEVVTIPQPYYPVYPWGRRWNDWQVTLTDGADSTTGIYCLDIQNVTPTS